MRASTKYGYGSRWPIGEHYRRLRLPPRGVRHFSDWKLAKVTNPWQLFVCDPRGRSRLVLYYHRRIGGPPAKAVWEPWEC